MHVSPPIAGPRGTAGALISASTGGDAEAVFRAGPLRGSPRPRLARHTGGGGRATGARGGWRGPAASGPWSVPRWARPGGVGLLARRPVRAPGRPWPAAPGRVARRRAPPAPRPGSGVPDPAVACSGRRSLRVPGPCAVASSGAACVSTLHEVLSMTSATQRDAAPWSVCPARGVWQRGTRRRRSQARGDLTTHWSRPRQWQLFPCVRHTWRGGSPRALGSVFCCGSPYTTGDKIPHRHDL